MAYVKTNWVDNTTPINETNLNKIESGIENNDINIGEENYDNTKTYEVGDIVRYNEKIYKCITAITTAENFDSSKWEQTNIVEIVQSEKSKIYELIEALSTPIVGEGENITLNDTAEKRFENFDIEGNSEQKSSPSPDYPSEVKSCGDNGSINEVICNKNLFDKNTTTDNTALNLSNGSIVTFNGRSTSDYIIVKYNTKYVFSKDGEKLKVNIVEYDKNKNFIKGYTGDAFTTSNDTRYIKFYFGTVDMGKIQLEQDVIVTSYEEHQSQSYTIPTQQPMRAIGDTRDTFIKKNNKWYEHHPIVRIESYNGETITSEYISNTGELSTGATVDYISDTPVDIECTEEQSTILFDIEQNAKTYKGVTHIYSNDEVSPNCYVEAVKDLTTLIQ